MIFLLGLHHSLSLPIVWCLITVTWYTFSSYTYMFFFGFAFLSKKSSPILFTWSEPKVKACLIGFLFKILSQHLPSIPVLFKMYKNVKAR